MSELQTDGRTDGLTKNRLTERRNPACSVTRACAYGSSLDVARHEARTIWAATQVLNKESA